MVQNVRFTFLGSGTSAGVPIIGCDCRVCTSTDPRDQRLRCSAYLHFTDAGGHERGILIDASPDLRQQVLRHGIRRLDAILFTHHHVDHIFGLDEIRRFNVVMGEPINIYAEPRTMENLHRVYQHIFDAESNVNPSFVASVIPNFIEPGVTLLLFGLAITPLRLLHGRLPIVGFRIERADRRPASGHGGSDTGAAMVTAESEDPIVDDDISLFGEMKPATLPMPVRLASPLPLAYCTDVSAIPPETWPHLTGLRTLVIDALRFRHHPTHFNIDQAVQAAAEVQAERTFLIHMTHDVMHAEVEPELPGEVHLAWDGLTLGGNGAMADQPPRG